MDILFEGHKDLLSYHREKAPVDSGWAIKLKRE